MAANNDVGQAIITAWNAAGLDTTITGGIYADKRPSPRPDPPYATLEVRKDPKANEYSSSGDFIDYRRVKITLYGVGKKAIGDIISAVRLAIEGQQGQPVSLTIPNATWMRTEPQMDDINLGAPVAGDDIRECPLEWTIWSHRTKG